jgi:hypothetical protein
MTESNGEVLFFDETNEQVFGVDGPVAEALVLLDRGRSLGQAVTALLDVYDVDEATLERDVATVLETLAAHALLRAVAPGACAPPSPR